MKPTFSPTRFLAILAAGAVLGFGSFLIDAPSASAATATSEVKLTSQLVDESGVLSEQEKADITASLKEATKESGKKLYIVFVPTAPGDIKALAEQLREHVVEWVVKDAGLEKFYSDDTKLLINPSGSFIVGGPMGDAGLTGRKIIVDTYGGTARHGGGAFSGKDPSKVDRSAAYAMRWVAKNIVAADLADRAEVQVAYAIGRAKPVGLYVETFGTAKHGLDDAAIQAAIDEVFDLRPAAIIRELDLLRPIYQQTATYGHFGRTDIDLPWEKTDRVDALRRAAGL